MIFAVKSHIGLVRTMNQDCYAIQENVGPMRLYVVADGMGGASAGEVASRVAVDAMVECVSHTAQSDWTTPEDLLTSAVDYANGQVCQTALTSPLYRGMGTTVVAALVDDQSLVIAHAGDSRAYGLLDGQFRRLTEDHSLVAELVRRGQLTEDEALHHPQRHIVTRSLGTTEFGYADVQTFPWKQGDAFLLCSDGLSNLVADDEIAAVMQEACNQIEPNELDRQVESLLTLALQRGGFDNITVLVIVHSRVGDLS